MTLRFLGEVSRDRVDEMGRLLSRSLSGTFQFQIVLDQTGTFNRKGRPSVLWLGPSRIPADLVNLAAKVDRALAGFGSSSRVDRFTPHVTLGRFATGDGIPTIEATLEDVVPVAFLVKVTSVVLFESVLGQGCPLYIPRASVALCDLPNRETELY